ncbi:unnamed protein product [Rotaria sp. Silwood1]|nr:unnamed protein product [Rotaria sp. Silwood1]
MERSMIDDNNKQSANSNIYIEQIAVSDVGRFQYQDGEVTLFQNQLKPSDFFFAPFPHVEPNLTDCNYNDLSGYTELTLAVSLYTTNLLESAERHIKSQNDTCHAKHCGVSLLPTHSIRLIQKGLRTRESKKEYILDSEWHSNAQFRQTIDFIIYTPNMSTCERLKNSITSRCRLSNFEVQYSLLGQQTVARTLEVTTEHVTKTSMYNEIKSQFPSDLQDIIALTDDDYKNLLTETMDQITMNLQVEEGYESIQNLVGINRLLDLQLQYKQVQLTKVNDQLWESLYWTPELTRPDQLSKVLNKVIKQDATDSNKFIYDYSQADEALKQNLKFHDRQKLDKLEKYLAKQSQNITHTTDVDTHVEVETDGSFFNINSESMNPDKDVDVDVQNTNNNNSWNDDLIYYKIDMNRFNGTNNERKNGTTIIVQRKDVKKLLRYLSEHVELEDDIIKPKSIDVTLVKVGSLKSRTKLFSNSVLVKTRMNVHVLPLRCPYVYRDPSLANSWLAKECHRLSNDVNAMRTALNTIRDELNAMNSTINQMENRIYRRLTAIPNIPVNAHWAQNGVVVAGGREQGNSTNQLKNPLGLFIDDDQTIFIADTYNHRIVQWKMGDTNGQVVAGGHGAGNQSDQLNLPIDVLIDKETDSLIICDRENRRVVRWSRRHDTTQGEVLVDNIYCYGLAMDNQRYLYISDTDKHEVRRYQIGDKNGTIVAGSNGRGADLNQLAAPTYIFVDQQQTVYVSEYYNHRVVKWNKGATEGIVVAGGQGEGKALTQLSYPHGLFVDTLGTLYVADTANHRVMRWPKGAQQGTVIPDGNGQGAGANQLNWPRGLSFDRHGNLYVVEEINSRVQRFSIE